MYRRLVPALVVFLSGSWVLGGPPVSASAGGTAKAEAAPVATPLRTAPEPAVSPAATTVLPGTLVALAGNPEGIAVDASGEVGVNVRRPAGVVSFPIASPTARAFLPTGGTARHLVLGATDGVFLIPDETDNTLLEVALPAQKVVARIRVGHQPHDAIPVGAHTVFAADELASTLHVIHDGRVVRVVRAPLQPGGMAANAAGTRVLVVGVRARRIVEYTATGRVIGAANCGQGPTHAVAGDGGLFWVADTNGGAVLGFEMGPRGPVQVVTIPVGPQPYGLAFDTRTDTVWVTLTGDDQLLGLHLHGTAVTSRTFYDTPRQPNTVAVDQATGEVVVAAATKPGVLQFLPHA